MNTSDEGRGEGEEGGEGGWVNEDLISGKFIAVAEIKKNQRNQKTVDLVSNYMLK